LSNSQNKGVLFSQPHNSRFRESRQIATEGAYESVLNGALAEFVRGLSRDPGLLESLKEGDAKSEKQ
jgi:hypothetical protein